jgi:hypothetical protein
MQVTRQFFGFPYKVGVKNLPDGQSAKSSLATSSTVSGLGRM